MQSLDCACPGIRDNQADLQIFPILQESFTICRICRAGQAKFLASAARLRLARRSHCAPVGGAIAAA